MITENSSLTDLVTDPPIKPLIEIERLSLHYGKKAAFSEVNLSILPGELMALVGPSGCGKSSLLQSLNRLSDLLPNCQVQGRIRIGEAEVLSSKANLRSLRQQVGLIFQKPNPFPFSIQKNLALPLKEHGMKDRDAIAHRTETVLQQVGLWSEVKDRLHTSALALSGGQQQRLCIARALVLQPQVLLLDEPCSALDPLSSGVVEDLIASLKPAYTLIMVTHNLAQARRIADRVAVFWVKEGTGHLIETGTVQQIFQAPQHELTRAYISGDRG
ncbi:MAG: phosphate ABC transporter ATP-binding protein [Leptolyngbya foveolarum]|uniref:Phosphate ABC transporter ATP-binding protein n=1 Tax=Leptolyngbya foveolarum TaxID=47253 RepID=A0A2W4TSH2_9CYAN|nr:MAG: phosphate ABC transporter ATP-binding protein [Leptolyngbya foveolarum]